MRLCSEIENVVELEFISFLAYFVELVVYSTDSQCSVPLKVFFLVLWLNEMSQEFISPLHKYKIRIVDRFYVSCTC